MRRRERGCGRRASAARRILYTARMATAPKPDPANFRLSVKDFGPIVEADVDFRPLTVFVGPSNTGKSYLATLAYALHQVLMDEPRESKLGRYRPRRVHQRMDIPEKNASAIKSWARKISSSSSNQIVPQEIEGVIRSGIENHFKEIHSRVTSEMQRCFGIDDINQFHRKPKGSGAKIQFSKDGNFAEKDGFIYEMILKKRMVNESIIVPPIPPFSINRDMQRTIDILQSRNIIGDELRYFATHLAESITDSVFPQIIGALNQSVHYLPAERAGIMRAQSTVKSALIEQAQYAGIRRSANIILLSGVLADFLQHLLIIERLTERNVSPHNPLKNTATELEKTVLGGSIRYIRSESGHSFLAYHPEEWRDHLPLMNASSMVTELASVVLFLRYIVKHNDVLIIDEPESHLHPDMQVKFTRLLAKAVQHGLRVILTTHSEWVVETIGNLVELSKVPEDQRATLSGGSYALPAEHVGMWLFRPKKRPRGSVVEEVVLDPDTGVYGVGYDEVAMALHNEWADAANRSV